MRLHKIFFFIICELSLPFSCLAYENPLLNPGHTDPDGKLGVFSQNNTGDCFFLASLIAIAQDADGKQLIESAFHHDKNKNLWRIKFPNLLSSAIEITEQQIKHYKLTDSAGDHFSAPAYGDPDVKMLEIAADQIWKNTVKAEGLWDDVPMNAIFMFSNTEQLLLWNRNKASNANTQDIDKYKRIPKGVVNEIAISSSKEVLDQLKTILVTDNDGISMILVDYINYHADVITHIDIDNSTYSYIDTTLDIHIEQNLTTLLQNVANGQYAINYLEIK